MLIEQPIRDSYIQTKILEERRSKGRELIRNYIHIYIHTITTSFIFPDNNVRNSTESRWPTNALKKLFLDERQSDSRSWIARGRKGGAKGREKKGRGKSRGRHDRHPIKRLKFIPLRGACRVHSASPLSNHFVSAWCDRSAAFDAKITIHSILQFLERRRKKGKKKSRREGRRMWKNILPTSPRRTPSSQDNGIVESWDSRNASSYFSKASSLLLRRLETETKENLSDRWLGTNSIDN